jgi:hypothetical protein
MDGADVSLARGMAKHKLVGMMKLLGPSRFGALVLAGRANLSGLAQGSRSWPVAGHPD